MSHAIIALWSHPRSMSTAFERVMRARGDLECLHEPFMYDYYLHRSKRAMPHFDAQDDHPRSYQAIRDMILDRADRSAVFFKDMSYYVVPHIFDDPDFLDRVTHSFLLRDLKASIVSYAKLDPEFTLEEVGVEAQWQHFSKLLARSGRAPIVVRSEKVQADPDGQMRGYWQAVGLPPAPHALNWNEAAPDDWHQVSGWHQDVIASSAIRPFSPTQAKDTQASFAALIAHRPRFEAYYRHHAAYQERLRSYAI